ncbi:nucleoside transporter FUN26-like isoform X2 [Strongylocentrotus purpuratus]|uniref:Equilibrative nucleoside transporter 3 n=1 Tax=Strongylocentrotus purpuratus TaxID=7668 RepID=A0A7M7PTM5_STRPU|nr:nucleoside transporter FUN26-like isoform X2 [Strongylocentrotus purpuratus]
MADRSRNSEERQLKTISRTVFGDAVDDPDVVKEDDQRNGTAEGQPLVERTPSNDSPEVGNNNGIQGPSESGTDDTASSGDVNPLVDTRVKFNVMAIFFIQGIGTLYPWNSFLTVEWFFTDYKFANVSDSTEYKDKFNLYITFGNFAVYVLFLFIALFFAGSRSKLQCFVCLVLQLFLFIFTTILAAVDSSQWPGAFFGVTMVIVVLFSAGSAVYQSGMYSLAAKIPGSYSIDSYIAGQGCGGTFVAVFTIISTRVTDSLRGLAIMHFSIASVVLLVCTITYRLLFKLDYVRSALPRGDDQAKAWDFSRKNLRNLWKIVKIRFPRMTCIAVIIRVIFILFIFCNYRPDQRTLPVWLKNDIAYAFFVVVFSLSNGYLKTIIVDDGINSVSDRALKSKAASVMLFFLVLGIFLGVAFSRVYPMVVNIPQMAPNANVTMQ